MTVLLHSCTTLTNKTPGEKARCKLYKTAVCFFEQILEVAPYKMASVLALTFHVISYPKKMSKNMFGTAGNVSDIILWTPPHGNTTVGQPVKTYIYQLCADTGCHLEDLPRVMTDRVG